MSFVEKIEKLTPFDEKKQAKEGQRDFRQNAAYSWSWLIEHTKEVNSLINKLNTLKVPEDTILLTKEYVDKEINIVKNDYALKNGDSSQAFKVKAGEKEDEAVNLKQLKETFPKGFIGMWSGSIATIPTGWALCNGSNGTPDLRDRFVVGAGNSYIVGAIGGSKNAIVVAHSHTGTTNSTGAHTHIQMLNGQDGGHEGNAVSGTAYGSSVRSSGLPTSSSGAHSHTITMDNTGKSGINANLPPYYALAFIIKL